MKNSRILMVLTLLLMAINGVSSPASQSRPNFIVILADDLGCGDISLYDGWIRTPQIDQMAGEGVMFTDFHSNSSVCSPTRAALLTGRYQQRAGIVDVIAGHLNTPGLETTEVTLSQLLKQNGYRTAIFGKWHLGNEPRQNPIHHGFDEFIGFLPGGCDYLLHDNWMEGTEVRKQEGYSTHIITDRSVDFLQRNKDKPFFLYISHQAVHNYYQVPSDPPGTRGRDIPLSGEVARERYKIMLEDLDKAVGEINEAIRMLGLEENTLVIFFSDNGDVQMGTNTRPYRGGKFSNYEGGHRVPAFAWWPGHIKAGWKSDELLVGMDILPTIMDIAGIDISGQRNFDGISMKDHLLNQADMPDRQVFFGYEPKLGTAMRDGNWKMQTRGDVIELYDLSKDIKETTNLADQYPGRTKEMKAAIEKWKREVAGPSFESAEAQKADIEEIILVYKSHFDIGYTHLASETIENYRTRTIEGALDVVDQNKNLPIDQQFVWTIPGWPMKKILEDWDGQTPERSQRVRDAFRDGRFAVHALPFTMQIELMEPEGMVRSLGFASKLAREAGQPLPTGAKMTDVPTHTKFTPTLLKNAGVNFLHLGCNPGSTPPEVPFLFWWEGPDGSRLLTMYSATYGNGLFPPDDWKYKTWIAMMMGSDNKPPPSPEKVREHIETIQEKFPGVKVRIGTIGDFGDRMVKEDLSDIPVLVEDMPDSWIHGPMCDPFGIGIARKAVPDLFAAESLHTLLEGWEVESGDVRKNIADGYESSILFYEHTWGGAIDWVCKYLPAQDNIGQVSNWFYGDQWRKDLKTDKYDRHQLSWEEHTDYARDAGKITSSTLQDGLVALARNVDIVSHRTVAFNPLPWKRDALINGTLVKDIPAGGYKALPVVAVSSTRPVKAGNSFENDHFKIVIDPGRGAIASLIDKRSGRELVDGESEHGFGQYLHEQFSADEIAEYCRNYIRGEKNEEGWDEFSWAYAQIGKPNLPAAEEMPYRAKSAANCTLTRSRCGSTTTFVMSAAPDEEGINYPVTTRIHLYDDAAYVDLELTIEKPADIWPEAGWICLPFKLDNPQFRVGRNGFIMDPSRDIIPGANRYMYALGTGAAMFDQEGRGVGVCAPETPLLSIGVPGCWKFDKTYVPEKPSFYFNLFNNQWTTNYRFWNEGKWTYRFRIWSFDQYDAASALITPSLEMRYPVQTASANTQRGKLPVQQRGLSVSRPGVMITAFGSNPDGVGTLLRVWEQAGVSGKLIVELPEGNKMTKATPVNLRGEKIGDSLRVQDDKLTFELGAYAPLSFLLE